MSTKLNNTDNENNANITREQKSPDENSTILHKLKGNSFNPTTPSEGALKSIANSNKFNSRVDELNNSHSTIMNEVDTEDKNTDLSWDSSYKNNKKIKNYTEDGYKQHYMTPNEQASYHSEEQEKVKEKDRNNFDDLFSSNGVRKDTTTSKPFLYTGANWNEHEDSFTQAFYEQNLSQFWRPEDISLQSDLNVWNILPAEIQNAYSQNLLVLTFLDTYQGDIGMPVVARSMDDSVEHQRKSVLNFMSAMENAVHAKSYSNIFMTYLKNHEINELYEWGNRNHILQKILDKIVGYYRDLDRFNYMRAYGSSGSYDFLAFKKAQYRAMTASVFLETCLFYSGFFYPLYFYGQGKLMQAGEIINLILRDESVHGLYVGKMAQEIYQNYFNDECKKEMSDFVHKLLLELYELELELTEMIYDPVDLTHDVKVFLRYNANKALMNLGYEAYFEYEEVNPVVLNGLNTETKTMDNFSMKGNGYQKMKSEDLKDEDFLFDFNI